MLAIYAATGGTEFVIQAGLLAPVHLSFLRAQAQ
jgi:hypothetical protein